MLYNLSVRFFLHVFQWVDLKVLMSELIIVWSQLPIDLEISHIFMLYFESSKGSLMHSQGSELLSYP